MLRRLLITGVVLAAAVAATALLLDREPARPNVILITLDTFRRDHFDPNGGNTPNLARVAGRGVRFDGAQAACPLTLPSHASMLTGLYPPRHGLRDNLGHVLPGPENRGFPTLAEILGDAGFATAAFVSAATLDADLGLDAGFEVYEDPDRDEAALAVHVAERTADVTNDAVRSWLDAREDDRPLFLWVHYFDPHAPYAAPFPYDDGETDREKYAREVAYVDHEVGALLDHLEERGLLENAVIAVMGDHGEGLGDHGERTHGHLLRESTLAVPFFLVGPGVPAAEAVPGPTRTTDLLPTLLGLLGLASPGDIDGEDLARRWRGESDEFAVPTSYAESLYSYRECGWAQQSALTVGDLKLIDTGPRRVLFDLAADPGERSDLAEQRPERVAALLEVLREIRRRPPPSAAGGDPDVLPAGPYGVAGDPERTRRFLPDRVNAALPAPIDRMHVVRRMDQARERFSAGDWATAIAILDALVPEEPDNPSLGFWRAYTLRKARQYSAAADEAARTMALGLVNAPLRDLRLNSLVLAGRHDEAATLWTETADSVGATPRARLAMAQSLMARGRHEEALDHVTRALEAATPGARDHQQGLTALRVLADPRSGAPASVRDAANALLETRWSDR